MSDSPEFPLRWRGRETGPHPLSEINQMLDDHKIGMGHEIFYQDKWMTLEQFFPAWQRAQTPEPSQASPAAPAAAVPFRVKVAQPAAVAAPVIAPSQIIDSGGRPRSRLVFALLAVFLGFTGAHNFYARQWMTGMLQLLLSVATSVMSFGIIASWIWAIVEAVVVRRDGQGREMT
ncbi:MAG TPA: TM2 domain-containing protein [Verrucomicrobiae bacterium]|jgi:TM2 domain-containing membrane protein YozV